MIIETSGTEGVVIAIVHEVGSTQFEQRISTLGFPAELFAQIVRTVPAQKL
jgi:hypothetical protein